MSFRIGNIEVQKVAAGNIDINKIYIGSVLLADFTPTPPSTPGPTTLPPTTSPPATVPDAPTGLSSTEGDTELQLTWTAPVSDGGSAITSYTVRYTPSGGSASTISTASALTSYTLTGLTNGVTYTVEVAAENLIGIGPYSSSITDMPVSAAPPSTAPPPPPPPPTTAPPPPPGTTSPPGVSNLTLSGGDPDMPGTYFYTATDPTYGTGIWEQYPGSDGYRIYWDASEGAWAYAYFDSGGNLVFLITINFAGFQQLYPPFGTWTTEFGTFDLQLL